MQRANLQVAVRRLLFAAFVLLEIYVGWKNFRDITASEEGAGEPVAEWERRLMPLKRAMPFTQGVVGYISDSGVMGINYYDPNDQIEYTLTQYVMAPVIVRKGTDHEWIIANFNKPAFDAWVQANPGKYQIRPLSYGIYLLHRLQP